MLRSGVDEVCGFGTRELNEFLDRYFASDFTVSRSSQSLFEDLARHKLRQSSSESFLISFFDRLAAGANLPPNEAKGQR